MKKENNTRINLVKIFLNLSWLFSLIFAAIVFGWLGAIVVLFATIAGSVACGLTIMEKCEEEFEKELEGYKKW